MVEEPSTSHACRCFDFTIHGKEGARPEPESFVLCERLRALEDQSVWAFQLEKGGNGNYHYQGRVYLPTKVRLQTLFRKLRITSNHLSFTSKSVADGVRRAINSGSSEAFASAFAYVIKEETRVEGPWVSWEVEKPIQLGVRNMKELWPWQQRVKDMCSQYSERYIDVLIDEKGGTGKTKFALWMKHYGNAISLPALRSFEKTMGAIISHPLGIRQIYIFDIPRALPMDAKEEAEFWSGLEYLKDGRAFDTRYRFKEIDMWIEPHVWVFMNYKPDLRMLTGNRWRLWKVEDRQLHMYFTCSSHDMVSEGPIRNKNTPTHPAILTHNLMGRLDPLNPPPDNISTVGLPPL